ncbi:hypothetical protein K505DRAFT_77291 [Melanomma pulvis-pyrius CBS 109.77]|uniref:Uncharacterized protein n=1 Tax=Melanomma pulvis-pyrius CBS 109.77 TaxID=1314802 RepID=A0A6A6X2B5_9PLEO|nr:hypothetical protein K505DRAFT_77291 [Melanomma pulvis-pyrius CBS 109.77]
MFLRSPGSSSCTSRILHLTPPETAQQAMRPTVSPDQAQKLSAWSLVFLFIILRGHSFHISVFSFASPSSSPL